MQDAFPIYEALWRRGEAEGAFVFYNKLWPERAGFFRPPNEDFNTPQLTLYREFFKDPRQPTRLFTNAPEGTPAPNILAELFTLSHEFGHLASWAGRTPRAEWTRYRAAADTFDAIGAAVDDEINVEGGIASDRDARFRAAWLAGLTDDDRARILAEEALAWDVGRELLIKLGFDDLARYDNAKRLGLHKYRYKFSMDELWPEDAEDQ